MFLGLNPQLFISFVFFFVAHYTSFAQGKIVMNGATMNIVNSGYVITSDVSLTNASTINVNSSTIKIAGVITNSSGIFDVTSGTVEMNGSSAQTIPASAFTTNKIQNLIISNNVTLAGEDSLTGALSFGASSKDFTTGGYLTLKSTAANTARVADITNAGVNSANTITGNVKVERFVQAGRAWRLLTAPISATGAQTINAAWQEGQISTNTVPGFGIHITGGTIANGFDQGVNNNSALNELVGAAWVRVANTNATLITNQPGYMVFVRGDRSTNLSQGINAVSSSTIMRSTGKLKTNDQTYTVAATGFSVVGNPFASPIDLRLITKTNVQDNFYLWDPKLTGSNGVGAYVNVSWNGASYDITPASGGSGLNQFVQSGSAFLAKSLNGTSGGSLIIKETDKAQSNINAARTSNSIVSIRTNLLAKNSDGTISVADGILNSFSSMYSDSIDSYDAPDINNISESLSSVKEGKLFVAERRQPLGFADTIFLNMLQMKVKSYQFQITTNNFSDGSITGYLEDSYLNTSTPINLFGTTTFDFNVINVPGSWNPQRFRIVFKQSSALPVTFSTIKAFEQNSNIKVEWKVDNEINIKQYDVEKSANGQQFKKVNITNAIGVSTYNWLDENSFEGNNYYRIKSIGVDGEIKYSSVVKVFMIKVKSGIYLKTNIIANKEVILLMNNVAKGAYAITITNNAGQLMYTKKIEHAGGNNTETIQLNKIFIAGIYHLQIIQPDHTGITMKLLIQ